MVRPTWWPTLQRNRDSRGLRLGGGARAVVLVFCLIREILRLGICLASRADLVSPDVESGGRSGGRILIAVITTYSAAR